jgi:predicted Zn finger-like uncharacterized protein
MDVTCPRCQTDYEFDDTLVSDRGTTVKCTNCGHQFRVFRPRQTLPQTPDLWRVERTNGELLELRSLMDLQRAIRAARVTRDDILLRGDVHRRLGDIEELDGMFPLVGNDTNPRTLPMTNRPPSEPPPARKTKSFPPLSRSGSPALESLHTTPIEGPKSVRPVPSPAHEPIAEPPKTTRDAPVAKASNRPAPPPLPAPSQVVEPVVESKPPHTEPPVAIANPKPRSPRLPEIVSPFSDPPAADSLELQDEDPRDDRTTLPPTRPRSYMWLTLLIMAIFGGVTAYAAIVYIRGQQSKTANQNPPMPPIAREISTTTTTTSAPVSSASQAPSAETIADFDLAKTALLAGDLLSARDAFVRASVAAPQRTEVWEGLCTVESELALSRITAHAMGDLFSKSEAKKFAEAAETSCEKANVPLGTSPQGLRLAAARADAKSAALISKNINTMQSRMLADFARDLGATGDWKSRLANMPLDVHAGDQASGSELALLTWIAHTKQRDDLAATWLAALIALAPKHPLIEPLQTLVPMPVDAGLPADAAIADTTPAAVDVGEAPKDFRAALTQGNQALGAGNLGRAEELYNACLAQHPGDLEALYGLGVVSQRRQDHSSAIMYFKQAKAFLPALLGLADEQWAAGQSDEAKQNYSAYLERSPEGAAADRARQRLGKPAEQPSGTP